MLLFSLQYVIILGDGFIHFRIEIDHMKLLIKMNKLIKKVNLKMIDKYIRINLLNNQIYSLISYLQKGQFVFFSFLKFYITMDLHMMYENDAYKEEFLIILY